MLRFVPGDCKPLEDTLSQLLKGTVMVQPVQLPSGTRTLQCNLDGNLVMILYLIDRFICSECNMHIRRKLRNHMPAIRQGIDASSIEWT